MSSEIIEARRAVMNAAAVEVSLTMIKRRKGGIGLCRPSRALIVSGDDYPDLTVGAIALRRCAPLGRYSDTPRRRLAESSMSVPINGAF